MRSNYTDYKPRTINRKQLMHLWHHVGQHDKEWGALVTLLVDRKEEWWVAVMGVGLDPELTNWSVHLGPVNFLSRRGYKEHHWLVIPHQPLRLSSHHQLHQCLLIVMPHLLTSFLVPLTNWELVGPPFVSTLKQGAIPLRTVPSPCSCHWGQGPKYPVGICWIHCDHCL